MLVFLQGFNRVPRRFHKGIGGILRTRMPMSELRHGSDKVERRFHKVNLCMFCDHLFCVPSLEVFHVCTMVLTRFSAGFTRFIECTMV